MKLLGSQHSPYVRRIRLFLAHDKYEFATLNVSDEAQRAELKTQNPITQIPVLIDKDQLIWDSRNIYDYLRIKKNLPALSWNDINTLTASERLLDAGVNLIMLTRSGLKPDTDFLFRNRQTDRISTLLAWFQTKLTAPEFKEWNFLTMSLYTTLDWMNFREIVPHTQLEPFQGFLELHKSEAGVTESDPRIGA